MKRVRFCPLYADSLVSFSVTYPQLAEALRTCAAQVAQRPELVPAFASMVSTTAAALFEACHSLYKNRSASGAAEENDRCRLGTTTKTQSPSAVSWCGSTSTGASDCEDVALMVRLCWGAWGVFTGGHGPESPVAVGIVSEAGQQVTGS